MFGRTIRRSAALSGGRGLVGAAIILLAASESGALGSTCRTCVTNTGSVGEIVSPTPGSTLTGSSVTFSWSAGTATYYDLNIGSTLGGRDLYDMVDGPNLSVQVTGLPGDGRRLYVRLWSWINLQWQYVDYDYTAASAIGGRAFSDQPDDLTGPQLHVDYVLPSDSADRQLDVNGAIANSMSAITAWLRGQTDGRSLRVDTYAGAVDVTFVRLNRTDAQMKAYNQFVRDQIELELRDRGYLQPNKVYAVYYDGGSAFSCGGGAWPPDLVGQLGAIYLKGTPPGSIPCDVNVVGASPVTPAYWEFAILHEVLHTLGFVATCAPHQTLRGHVSDDPRDLMYAGSLPWQPSILDVGRDDYYNHNVPGCLDFAASTLLSPPVNGLPPTVVTGVTTAITRTGATLNATVNPNGAVTSATFEYGPTTAYGITTPVQSLGSGNIVIGVGGMVSGLACNTLYHFRAMATNSSGTTNGSDVTFTTRSCVAPPGDFDGDGKADLTIWRPGSATWFWLTSSSAYHYAAAGVKQWGSQALGDVPLLRDIDGDRQLDLIVWRASTGTWYWLTSSTGYSYATQGQKQWGNQTLGDVPMLGDIDGDGKADLIIWRASTGTWFWLTSSSGYSYAQSGTKQWGNLGLGDVPKVADMDGDGNVDLVVWRASTGTWYWLTSSSGYNYSAQMVRQWGNSSLGDVPLLGDLDGDGLADLTVWRAPTGTWFWLTSSSGFSYATAGVKQWGNQALGDIPLLTDLDGDGTADPTVWRASNGTWFWLTSRSGYNYGTAQSKQWGSQAQGDIPMNK